MNVFSIKFCFTMVVTFLIIGGMSLDVNAQLVTDVIKNTAGCWSTDAISETEFVNEVLIFHNFEVLC